MDWMARAACFSYLILLVPAGAGVLAQGMPEEPTGSMDDLAETGQAYDIEEHPNVRNAWLHWLFTGCGIDVDPDLTCGGHNDLMYRMIWDSTTMIDGNYPNGIMVVLNQAYSAAGMPGPAGQSPYPLEFLPVGVCLAAVMILAWRRYRQVRAA